MNQNCSLPKLDKLVSKLKLDLSPVRLNNGLKQTNFAKCNQSLYLQNYRSFRNTKGQRFKKHNNLVEANKQNIMKLNTAKTKTEYKTGFHHSAIITPAIHFDPKREEDILAKHNQTVSHDLDMEQSSANLQLLLRKKKMKNSRNLLGFNILQLQKRYNYSRFELHTLHSIYNTLLFSSKESLAMFKDNFEVMLNMNKISVRFEVLEKIFREQDQITFQKFIEMYGKIDEVIFKQNIIDYIEILFEGIFNKDNIRFEDIVRILKNRITEKESIDIAQIIYEQNNRDFEKCIRLKEITELCHCCQNFAKKMYRIYTSELKCD